MAEEDISIVKVRNVLLVTLPSSPSDRAIDMLQDKVLTKMVDSSPEGVIIDIKLVGMTVISGMQPSVAVTATELGLSFGGARTALTVEKALDMLSETKPFDSGKT